MRKPDGKLKMALLAPLAAVVLGTQFAAPTASAATQSIIGNWSGGGFVELNTGDRERVKCRATFRALSGKSYEVDARCVGGFGQIDQTGKLRRVSGNRFVGSLRNEQFDVSANVSITVQGKRQNVSITSDQGRSNLCLLKR